MAATENVRYQIMDLLLDTQLGTLARDGEEIALPQLSYKLLCELVSQAPAIISQDELMNRVWGDQVVSDETLKQRIKLLRQALDDSPQAPKYIESVRGRGYRCVAQVKKTVIKPKQPHDAINLRLNDRLPVSFLHGSQEYWRLTGLFLTITLLTLATAFVLDRLLPSRNDTPQVNTPIESPANSAQAKAAYAKGRVFYLRYQSMDNEMAIKSFLRATELDPSYAPAFAGLADAYSQGVFQFSGLESWQKLALDAAYDAVILDDTSAQSYKSLGNAHFVNGHLSQSLSANLKAVELDSQFVEAQASLGYIYSERGELKNAIDRHLLVLQANRDYQVNWFHIALTLQRLGEYELANRWYHRILAVQPNYHLATYHYSHMLQQRGRNNEALELLQQAQKRSPDSLNVIKGLIDFHLLAGQLDKASTWFHKLALLSRGENRQYAELLSIIGQIPVDKVKLKTWYDSHREEYNETPFHSIELAIAANALGATNGALRHLTEAVELGWLNNDYLTRLTLFGQLKTSDKFVRIEQLIERKRDRQKQMVKNFSVFAHPPD